MLLRIVLASLAASLCCVAPADAGCGDAGLCCPGRNADCVVQSYPLNFVPEDPVDEDRCYCDEHCVKLEDCCDDYHSACRAKNCLVGNFTAWSPCSTRCGVGIMTRSRDILQAASNGGEQCPHMEEKRGCMGFECSQNDSAAIKEVGLLLPLKYGKARDYNPDDDINKNIKEHYHKSYRRNEGQTSSCLMFEVVRSHKYCNASFDLWTKPLAELGNRVCVECQPYAMHLDGGQRCAGQGVAGVITRWKATNVPSCHGRWIQQEKIDDCACANHSDMPGFILL